MPEMKKGSILSSSHSQKSKGIQVSKWRLTKMASAHVAGATALPLRNWPDVRLVFFEPLYYRGSEITQKRNFHLRP